FLLLLSGAEIDDGQRTDASVSAETHAEAAGDSDVLSNQRGGDLVHVRAAVLLRDVHVGNADLAGFADQFAGDRKFLVLDLLYIGEDFVLREFIRGLSNLQMLFAQVLHGENLVSRVLFNQKTSTDQLGLVRNSYRRHRLSFLIFQPRRTQRNTDTFFCNPEPA